MSTHQTERDVCHLVNMLARRLEVHARRVAEDLGTTSTQVIALRELSEPITARELATRMYCEPSNATFVVDRLEAQGLIVRRPHPTDRRAKQIVLTEVGERTRADVLDRMSAGSPLADLTADEQVTLRGLLQTLSRPAMG